MTDLDRTKVTFAQAEGLEPLPSQLSRRELSAPLRAQLWYALHSHIQERIYHGEYGGSYIQDPWDTILHDMHIFHLHQPADEYTNKADGHTKRLKRTMMEGGYDKVYGTLEFVLRHPQCPQRMPRMVSSILIRCAAGYRLSTGDKTFYPVASEEEAQVASRAFSDLSTTQFAGARTHLSASGALISKNDFAGGVREAMQAVESVARVITGANTFAAALKELENRWNIHGALKVAFGRLYDYTSDEKGIRHPLLDDPNASVDEVDALFMFSACAAFISYLIGKTREGLRG